MLSDADKVATCLADLDADSRIEVTVDGGTRSITGRAAGGARIVIFSTGRGNAIGAPIAPTVQVTGNPNTAASMGENIDVDVSAILSAGEDLDSAGARVWDRVLRVAGGKLTSCEVLQAQQLSVSRFGPSV